MKPLCCFVTALFIYLIGSACLAVGQDSSFRMPVSADQPILATPAVKLLSPGKFEIDGCLIDKNENLLSFPAVVNIDKDDLILEYLLVENSGKLHESLLKTNVSPYAIQISLLLLGLEGSLNPLAEQGESRTPEGTRVAIRVYWQENGQNKSAPLHEWILNQNKPLTEIPWVFTGSYIHENGLFAAQVEKSIIAIFHDPAAIIDHQDSEGNSDTIWFVNTKQVPPAGTEVQVVIGKNSL